MWQLEEQLASTAVKKKKPSFLKSETETEANEVVGNEQGGVTSIIFLEEDFVFWNRSDTGVAGSARTTTSAATTGILFSN